jgi:hypothetical protein
MRGTDRVCGPAPYSRSRWLACISRPSTCRQQQGDGGHGAGGDGDCASRQVNDVRMNVPQPAVPAVLLLLPRTPPASTHLILVVVQPKECPQAHVVQPCPHGAVVGEDAVVIVCRRRGQGGKVLGLSWQCSSARVREGLAGAEGQRKAGGTVWEGSTRGPAHQTWGPRCACAGRWGGGRSPGTVCMCRSEASGQVGRQRGGEDT